MTAIELVQALRQISVETGSLVCLDCEHEHTCGIHGCAIMRTAADLLEQLTAEPPNEPLTLEELRGMDGEPVCVKEHSAYQYGLVSLSGCALSPKDEVITLCSRDFYLLAEMAENYEVYPIAYHRKPDGGVE